MGFNPRLAPYSVMDIFDPFSVATDATPATIGFYVFPFGGQVVGGQITFNNAIAADTTTGVHALQLWKFATDDATATFATSLVAAGMTDGVTGAVATARVAGVNVALTNGTAAQRRFDAGDRVLLRGAWRSGATPTRHQATIQMDYIIGDDLGTSTPTIAAAPAED